MTLAVLQLPDSAQTVLVVVNPNAGAWSDDASIEKLVTLLRGEGYAVEMLSDAEQLHRSAEEHLRHERLRAVVSVGGDGTAAWVVNATPPGAPIAIYPRGTENLLAKYLGLEANPADVFQMICDGRTVSLDAGKAGDRVFLLMLSCGFDAEVVRQVHMSRRGHIWKFSYIKPIWRALRTYSYPEIRLLSAGAEVQRARWAFVVNLPRYAAGLKIAPFAQGNDGLLDVCLFTRGGLWAGLTYLTSVFFQTHVHRSDFEHHLASRMRIESETPAPYQLDGDYGGELPVEVEVLPSRLTLLAPRRWVERQPGAVAESSG